MKNRTHNFALTTLAAAMTATWAPGSAVADDDLKQLTTPSSSISIGAGHWSGTREQYGVYDNLRGDDTILLLDADINKRDDATGTWMTGKVRNLGIDNRDAELRYDKQGDWGVGLDYYQIPHVAPYSVNSGVTGIGSTAQTIPTITPGTGADVTLKTERKAGGLSFYKFLAPHLNFKVDFKNEEKDGNRHWGYRGAEPVFVAEPIDSTTRQLEAVLEYGGKEFQLAGGYYGSWYDNHNSMLAATDNGGTNYLSLPLDNQAHQVFVNGGYNFTPTTRGTFRVAYTHATQDNSLPDPTGTGQISNLDGEMNTTLVQLGLSARPMPKLNLVASLRYHNVDDDTPTALLVPADQVHVKPNGYETISGKLEGTYRLPQGYSLIGGIEYKTQDRSRAIDLGDETWVPFRDSMDETTYRVQVRKSLSETVNGSLAFLHSKRDGSTYTPANAGAIENQINPVNIADRDRNKWRLSLDWTPMNNLGLQFNFEDSKDDYGPGTNPYGLVDGDARLVSLDADVVISEDWHLTAWASWDETKASQEYNNRSSRLKDTGKSVGVGIDGKVSNKLMVGADAQWTRTRSQYDDNVTDAYQSSTTALPDIKNKMTKFSLYAEYAVAKNGELRFDLIHEIWKTDDWTWTFGDGTAFTYGQNEDGTMIIQDPDQSATFVGVSYKYQFD